MAKSTIVSVDEVNDFTYKVASSSGNTYLVTCDGTIDMPGHPAEYALLWGCNCPARGVCHHGQAVIDYRKEMEIE